MGSVMLTPVWANLRVRITFCHLKYIHSYPYAR